MNGANLKNVDFTKCDFSGADLRDADFRGSLLTDAVFTDADLRGARLENTERRGSIGLPNEFEDEED